MTAMISDPVSRGHAKAKSPARSVGERASGETRDGFARPWLAQGDQPATAVLMPLLDVPGAYRIWVAAAFLLETIARDTIGDPDTAGPARWHHAPDETLISETADLLARVDRLASPPGTLTRPPRDPYSWRIPRAALSADQPLRPGDRRRAVPIGEHRQDAPASPVPKARRTQPHPGRRSRTRPRPARTSLAQALTVEPRAVMIHGGKPVIALGV